MDFAKNILTKYGWKKGQGIGKNSDGIVKPIKANLKFDKDGLGHDKAKDFTNDWWHNVYNEAANNIDIEHNASAGNDAVAISLKNAESIDISTNGVSLQKMRNKSNSSGYETHFQKMRTMFNSQIEDSEEEDQGIGLIEEKNVTALTDEQLLKACGGRTAHKGARHGLSLKGKLSRIEEQERQLLEKYSNNFDSNAAQEVFKDWVKIEKVNKKKHKLKDALHQPCEKVVTAISPDSEKLASLLNQNDYVVKYKSRKKKRQHKALDEDLATSLTLCLNTSNDESTTQILKGDLKLHGIQQSSTVIKKKNKNKIEKKRNKKKRKYKEDVGIIPDQDVEITEVDGIAPEARKYLKSSKHLPAADDGADEVDAVKYTKKRKRKDKEENKASNNIASVDNNDAPKLSKRDQAKLKKNNHKIAKITKKLENIMSLDENATISNDTFKKKKKMKKIK